MDVQLIECSWTGKVVVLVDMSVSCLTGAFAMQLRALSQHHVRIVQHHVRTNDLAVTLWEPGVATTSHDSARDALRDPSTTVYFDAKEGSLPRDTSGLESSDSGEEFSGLLFVSLLRFQLSNNFVFDGQLQFIIIDSKVQSIKQRNVLSIGESTTIIFPTVYFIGKYILVLDCDTFRLELDYRSIMHILVKVLSNQDSATRMALEPVRVQILSLGKVA